MGRDTVRALLVEDDEDDYVLTRDLLATLSSPRVTLDWKTSFAAGLEAVLEARHDVYLFDYKLGARDGVELAHAATNAGVAGPVILLTGVEDPLVDAQAASAGVADYLVKGQLSAGLLGRTIRYALAQRDAVEHARRSEARFRALVERLPEAVLVHRDRRLVYVNPALVDYLKRSRLEDVLGRPVTDVFHPDDAVAAEAAFRSIELGQAVPSREVRFTCPDGAVRVAEIVEFPIMFEGQPAIMATARDVTERRELRARLQLSERLSSLGTLAAGVAHEINNPLAYMTASLGLAAEQLERMAAESDCGREAERLRDVRSMIEEARGGAERVREIVLDLKTFARGPEAPESSGDVRRAIEWALQIAANEVRHRARLVKELEPMPQVRGGTTRVGQVILNLLLNAAQAIPEGAVEQNTITVRAGTDARGAAFIAISDTGSGIEPADVQRLFDPFFTTKHVGLGTGLGLSVCHGIVTALGGQITVESTLGRGSSFTVTLPAAPRGEAPLELISALPPRPPPSAPASLREARRVASIPPRPTLPSPAASVAPITVVSVAESGLRGRVLVVDDEPILGRLFKRVLADHEVTTFTRAADALARIAEGAAYDVIFCDLMMPSMTGMDFHEELDKLAPSLAARTIFLTGGAFTARAEQFLAAFPDRFLKKPIENDLLRATVAVWLDR